jgi:ornithine carbamoyltransferase
MRHLLTLFDLTSAEIEALFALAMRLKEQWQQALRPPLLSGRVLGLLFSKPSLRTRVSFEAAMVHLGGTSLYLGQDVGWGSRESVPDFARVLSQYTDAIVCRTHQHATLRELAECCTCPVINGLTDLAHPCQALADLFTLHELKGDLAGRKLAFVGDGNNVARSLAVACAKLQVQFSLASPPKYSLDAHFLQQLRADVPEARIQMTDDPLEAVQDADAVYTDVWSSMGQESEAAQRRLDFTGFQVNAELMKHAPEACFLHCLPARRGEEVTDDVMDGERSAILAQAANRMHVQKAILAWLLTGSMQGGAT